MNDLFSLTPDRVAPLLLVLGAVAALASVACVIALLVRAAATLALRLGVLAILASIVLAGATVLGSASPSGTAKSRPLSSLGTSSTSALSPVWLGGAALAFTLGVVSIARSRRGRR